MAHKWHPITDLDENDISHSVHDELRHLAEVWREQQGDLDQEQLRIFNEKLNREWAIETGQIEGVYDIDRGTTETLIERGFSEQFIPHTVQNPGKTLAMLEDHQHVVEGLFDFVNGGRELSASYVKEMHAALTQNQDTTVGVDAFGKKHDVPLLHGAFKEMPNNPTTPSGEVHQYCPPEQTASEMDNLVAMHLEHSMRGVPPLAEAAWLHHRFTQIHPFQDGNGRVARSLASVIFIKAGWFPLVINRGEMREKYIDALRAADGGDLSELIDLFTHVQKEFFNRAYAIYFDLQTSSTIKAAADKINRRVQAKKTLFRDYKESSETAEQLAKIALDRMHEKIRLIMQECPEDRNSFATHTPNGGGAASILAGIEKAVDALGCSINANAYCAHTEMRVMAGAPAHISIYFCAADRELIVCFACCSVGEYQGAGGSYALREPKVISDIFSIRYKQPGRTKAEFLPWLEKALSAGVRMWEENL